jgi:hypothetical protein
VIDFSASVLCSLAEESDEPLRQPISQTKRAEVSTYIADILNRSGSPSECLSTALIYLHRLRSSDRFALTRSNAVMFFASAFILATKWLDDKSRRMPEWGLVTGFSARDLVRTERGIIATLQWDLYIETEEYVAFATNGNVRTSRIPTE